MKQRIFVSIVPATMLSAVSFAGFGGRISYRLCSAEISNNTLLNNSAGSGGAIGSILS